MNDLINSQPTMTSLEIATLVELRHDNVRRTIENLAGKGAVTLPQSEEVPNEGPGPKTISVYRVGKRDSYVIVAQLSPEFTARLVDRWQQLEAEAADPVKALNDPGKLRQVLLGYTERVIALEHEVEVMRPKAAAIDECQEWGDKAQAMASYARQAKDETLRKRADRIQARAIRRCGELLRMVPNGAGRPSQIQDGSVPNSRQQAASDAGLSERQRKTALRVAAVPEPSFFAQVESEQPPTVTALAKQGTAPRAQPLVDLAGIPAADYARATEAMGTLRRFAEYCSAQSPARIAAAFKPHEVKTVREHVAIVDAWLDQFTRSPPQGADAIRQQLGAQHLRARCRPPSRRRCWCSAALRRTLPEPIVRRSCSRCGGYGTEQCRRRTPGGKAQPSEQLGGAGLGGGCPIEG